MKGKTVNFICQEVRAHRNVLVPNKERVKKNDRYTAPICDLFLIRQIIELSVVGPPNSLLFNAKKENNDKTKNTNIERKQKGCLRMVCALFCCVFYYYYMYIVL